MNAFLCASLLVGALFTLSARAAAPWPPPKLLNQQELASDLKLEKTRVGGLSGLVWDESEKIFWAVSDDRGKFGEPRVYGFRLVHGDKPRLQLEKVRLLKDPKKKLRIFDFEGITLLPWGNLLVSSEGDMNKKPRVQPALLEFKKKNGELVREYDLPPDYLAEPAGRQTKGVRNNFALEGLGGDGATRIFAATELPLVQDEKPFTRFLEIDQPAAWQLKPGREWLYPLVDQGGDAQFSGKDFNLKIAGVSEIQFVRDETLWVLERSATVGFHGLAYSAQIFEVRLPADQKGGRSLKKTKVFDLDGVTKANFEAMAWGPMRPDGKRLFVVMSDNNFEGGVPTRILFFEVEFEHVEIKKGS